LEKWDELAGDVNDLVAVKRAKAEANRNPPALPAGQVRSQRAVQLLSRKADEIDEVITELSLIEVSLRGACDGVRSARETLDLFILSARAEGISGVLESDYKKLLVENHINSQAYWAGTVVGPDARRFLQKHLSILGELKAKVEQTHGSEIADGFYTRLSNCLGPLAAVAHLTRKVEMLSGADVLSLSTVFEWRSPSTKSLHRSCA
jgi:hypothetical protein